MSVDVEVRGDALEVYYNRGLRARFAYETGEHCRWTKSTSPAKSLSRRARFVAIGSTSMASWNDRCAGESAGDEKGPRPKHVPQRMCIACRDRTMRNER